MTNDDDLGSSGRAMHELAAAASSLVIEHDVIGTVTSALAGCARAVNAAAAGIVVTRPDQDGLEFLAATSHRAEQLEIYQAQQYDGPAAETINSGIPLTVLAEAFTDRWPEVARVLRSNGVTGVHASPMKWQNNTLGAINLFFTDQPVPADVAGIAQAFSDLATLAIVHNGKVSPVQLLGQLRAALAGRAVIEQAKGAIAYSENLSLSDAFDRLLQLARRRRQSLSVVSNDIINAAMLGAAPNE